MNEDAGWSAGVATAASPSCLDERAIERSRTLYIAGSWANQMPQNLTSNH